MEAAFIDIGKGRNAVLYAGEVNWQSLGHKEGQPRKIESVLSSGQMILVQVTKDPVGHKGARLTSQVSLAGRFLVYVPGRHHLRHLAQAARHRAQPPQDPPQGDRPRHRRRHRAHRGRGRQRGGADPRRRAAQGPLGGHREEAAQGLGPAAALRRARPDPEGRPRPVHRGLRQARHRGRRRLGHRPRLRRVRSPPTSPSASRGTSAARRPATCSRRTGSTSRSTRDSTARSGCPRAAR